MFGSREVLRKEKKHIKKKLWWKNFDTQSLI